MEEGKHISIRIRLPKRVEIVPHVPRVGDHLRDRYVIDSKVPKRYRKSLIIHEIVEGELERGGLSYKKAHRITEGMEKKLFPLGMGEWKRYNKAVMSIYAQNKKLGKVM